MALKAIISDWDGVFYDSLSNHSKFMNKCCALSGVNFMSSFKGYLSRVGHSYSTFDSFIDAYRFFLSRDVHYTQYFIDLGVNRDPSVTNRLFIEFMLDESIGLFPDVIELFNNLKGEYLIGLVTSSYENVIKRRVSDFFDCLIDGDMVEAHKPSPEGIELCLKTLGVEPCEAVYIGDMLSDAKAAKLAGVPFIAVSWGYNLPELLKPNIGVAESVSGLSELINIHQAVTEFTVA